MAKYDVTNVPVGVHVGDMIHTCARTYPTLLEVMDEQVQNALDSNARLIEIFYNVSERFYTVSDNGEGVSPAKFHRALSLIGQSIKDPSEKKLGRFGKGLVAAIGKCVDMFFTSCVAPRRDAYKQWRMNSARIIATARDLTIPMIELDNLEHDSSHRKNRAKKERVWWRTQVRVEGLSEDKTSMSITMDGLAESIMTKYSTTMKRLHTKVRLIFIDGKGQRQERVVKGREFRGRALKEYTHSTDEGGQTVIRLFATRPADRKKGGAINVKFGNTDNDFRFSIANFATSYAARNLLSPEVMRALKSGLFEGEILSEKAVLRDTRRSFEQNDALLGLCMSIEEWYREVGEALLEGEKQENEDQRLQHLGEESLAHLDELVKSGNAPEVVKVIKSFEWGTIGTGHKGKRGTLQDDSSKSIEGGDEKKPTGTGTGRPRENPKKEKPEHMPFTVTGPEGTRRRRVKSNSLGLQISHGDLGPEMLWHLDTGEGILTYNRTHHLWQLCEDSDAKLLDLQNEILWHALMLEAAPDQEFKAHIRQFSDSTMVYYVQRLLHSRVITSARNSRKKSAEPKEKSKGKKQTEAETAAK